jgi:SAM-dependent methyltransferase
MSNEAKVEVEVSFPVKEPDEVSRLLGQVREMAGSNAELVTHLVDFIFTSLGKDANGNPYPLHIRFSVEPEHVAGISGNVADVLNELLGKGHVKDVIVKNFEKKDDLPEYPGCRLRKATEKIPTDEVIAAVARELVDDKGASQRMHVRQKQRVSIGGKVLGGFRLDVTVVREGPTLDDLLGSPQKYEVEMEWVGNKAEPPLGSLERVIEWTLCAMQGTRRYVRASERARVLEAYQTLLGLRGNRSPGRLANMPASSLGRENMDSVKRDYALTEKADGGRAFVIVTGGCVYVMDTNMGVRPGPVVDEALARTYDGTMIDGEFLRTTASQGDRGHVGPALFMAFDLLFRCGVDHRDQGLLLRRQHLAEVVKVLFGYDYAPPALTSKALSSVDGAVQVHAKDLGKRVAYLAAAVARPDAEFVVGVKHFIKPTGLSGGEIFAYMAMMWSEFQDAYPYKLDGLILSSTTQQYGTRDIAHPDLKWKPGADNSIDFYVRVVHDPERGGLPLTVFDHSDPEERYRYAVVDLMVGHRDPRGRERPVRFKWPHAHVPFAADGELRSMDGELVESNTVVECALAPGAHADPKRWVLLRTRHDKTEAVRRTKTKYGNYVTVAEAVLDTMLRPVTMVDIGRLAKSTTETLAQIMKELVSGTDPSTAPATGPADPTGGEAKESRGETKVAAYYAQKTDRARPMRDYNSWCKEQLIKVFGSGSTVLDLGCGQGGDIHKYNHANLGVVGVDPNPVGLYSSNGAVSRYNGLRSPKPDMRFIHAEPSKPFAAQADVGTAENRRLLREKLIGKRFDGIAVMYSAHYNFDTEASLAAFLGNLRDTIRPGGCVVVVCFDGEAVFKRLKDTKGTLRLDYLDADGEKRMLFEIKKNYKTSSFAKVTVGAAIDIHNEIFMEPDQYETEYLVSEPFFAKRMTKEGFALVETDFIDRLYNEDLFRTQYAAEKNPRLRTRLGNIIAYGTEQHNAEIAASREWNALFRYYVFQATGSDDDDVKK